MVVILFLGALILGDGSIHTAAFETLEGCRAATEKARQHEAVVGAVKDCVKVTIEVKGDK